MNNRIKIKYVKILKSKKEVKSNSIKSFQERWLENGTIAELVNGRLTVKWWDQHLGAQHLKNTT